MRALLVAVALALLAPVAALSQDAWKAWNYPEYHASVAAPATAVPQISQQDVPTAGGKTLVMHVVGFPLPQHGDAALALLVADLAGTGMAWDVDNAVKGAVAQAPNAQNVRIITTTVAGGPARDVTLTTNGRYFRGRFVVQGTRLYQMHTMTAPGATGPLPEAERFIASLTMTP